MDRGFPGASNIGCLGAAAGVCHIQHSPGTPTTGLRERGNDTGRSTGRSGPQKATTRRNMRREERVTVQGPVKEQQPDGMSHRGGGGGGQRLLSDSCTNLPTQFSALCKPKMEVSNPTLFFNLVTTHIDHMSHAKHILDPLSVFFMQFGYRVFWGASPKGCTNLLQQCSTPYEPKVEVSNKYFFDIVATPVDHTSHVKHVLGPHFAFFDAAQQARVLQPGPAGETLFAVGLTRPPPPGGSAGAPRWTHDSKSALCVAWRCTPGP